MMVADISDLACFNEGATLRTKCNSIDLGDLGLEAMEKIPVNDLRLTGGDDGISVSLKLVGEGGPGAVHTDRAALLSILYKCMVRHYVTEDTIDNIKNRKPTY